VWVFLCQQMSTNVSKASAPSWRWYPSRYPQIATNARASATTARRGFARLVRTTWQQKATAWQPTIHKLPAEKARLPVSFCECWTSWFVMVAAPQKTSVLETAFPRLVSCIAKGSPVRRTTEFSEALRAQSPAHQMAEPACPCCVIA
jgi:hypothetical protein